MNVPEAILYKHAEKKCADTHFSWAVMIFVLIFHLF